MDKKPAQYRVIAEYLTDGIASGRFDPSRRLPSEMELARKFQSSRPTVARAMLELQNQGLIERRVGSGTFIRSGVASRSTPTAPMGAFGLVVAGLGLGGNEVLDQICSEISRLSEQQGYVILRGEIPLTEAGAAGLNLTEAQDVTRKLIKRHVKGVFFAPLELPERRAAVNLQIAQSFVDAGTSVVLLDREILDFPERSPYDLVGIDNFGAGYNLARHLVSQGRTRIRFMARPKFPSTTDLRMAGARDAILREGFSVEQEWACFGAPSDQAFVRHLIREPQPDAIICANDRTAARLMQTLIGLGIRIPEHIAIGSFDDVEYATLISPTLTTVRQPCKEIAAVAMRLMDERLKFPSLAPRMVCLATQVIARRSTGA